LPETLRVGPPECWSGGGAACRETENRAKPCLKPFLGLTLKLSARLRRTPGSVWRKGRHAARSVA
jgi:hypothetical protein